MLNSKHFNWWVLLLLFLLVFSVRMPDLTMPLERDEGEYALAAQQILRGEMPYKDSFCQKPPVVFLWYMAGFLLFGQTITGIHLIMFIAATLAAFGMYLVMVELLRQRNSASDPSSRDRIMGLIVAALFASASAGSGYFGSAANTEIFMLAPVLFGIWLLLKIKEAPTRFRWFMLGFCIASATLTKQVAVFSFLAPLILVAYHLLRYGGMRSFRLVSLIGGIAAPVVPVVFWLGFNGALQDFIREAFLHNIGYVGSFYGLEKWLEIIETIHNRFMTEIVLWIALPVFILIAVFNKVLRSAFSSWFGILWFISSLLGAALGPYPLRHYFLQTLPPLCLITGLLLDSVLTCRTRFRLVRYGVAGIIVAGLIVPMIHARIATAQMTVAERSLWLYGAYGVSPFAAAEEMGQYVKQHSRPDDRILIIGSEPEILFYADRRSATRYTIFYPLTGPYADAEAMTREMLEDIRKYPPKMIIVTYCESSFIGGMESLQMIMSQIGSVLSHEYSEVDVVGTDMQGRVFWRNATPDFTARAIPLFQILQTP
jgi:4-amino-4-deoxy-L-arabinose transferase-like glycosyltransferase